MTTSEDRIESLRMIRDSASGIAPRTGDFKRIRALRFTEPGFDRLNGVRAGLDYRMRLKRWTNCFDVPRINNARSSSAAWVRASIGMSYSSAPSR